MANLYPVADSKIYIGTKLEPKINDMVADDFDAITSWTEIDGWETCGQIGDAAALITTQLINRGRDIKQKGTKNAGSMQNNFAIVADDPGQLAFIAASQTKDNYAFKIEWAGGTTVAFVGLAMSNQAQGGQANTMQLTAMNIEINSNIVELP